MRRNSIGYPACSLCIRAHFGPALIGRCVEGYTLSDLVAEINWVRPYWLQNAIHDFCGVSNPGFGAFVILGFRLGRAISQPYHRPK